MNEKNLANTHFKNKESAEMIIDGFKKEFRSKLLEIVNRELAKEGHEPDSDADPRDHFLDFNHVAVIMNSMGFLQSKLSHEQEEQLDDVYTVFKEDKD